MEGKPSSEESSEDESSSDDDREWTKELQRQHRLLRKESRMEEEAASRQAEEDLSGAVKPKFYEIRDGEDFKGVNSTNFRRKNKYETFDKFSALDILLRLFQFHLIPYSFQRDVR